VKREAAEPPRVAETLPGMEQPANLPVKQERLEPAGDAKAEAARPATVELASLPPELQLVAWLGRGFFLERLVPCDIMALVLAQEAYCKKHQCQACMWFDLLAAWLKDPFVIECWTTSAPAPGVPTAEIAQALLKVFRALPCYFHAELGRVLKGGRGTGCLSCFLSLGLVSKEAAAPDLSLSVMVKDRLYTWTQDFCFFSYF
jgi:hypothetical protein